MHRGDAVRRTVFVSSTFQDLQTHRKAVWDVLGKFNAAVRGMEQFGARTGTPLETCLVEVEQSDIYVGVIAFRLGSIEPTTGKSYTQLEYERAVERSKEVLIYLVDEENARVPVKFIDNGEARDKLESFKRTLRDRHTIDTFVDEGDLAKKIERDLRAHLVSRQGESEPIDDLELSRSLLSQFALLPKSVAGKEVRLTIRVSGAPYAASRAVCTAFNFEFGATLGVPIKIEQPAGFASADLADLFIQSKIALEMLPLTKGDRIDAYVRLHFSDSELEQLKARFRPRTDYSSAMLMTSATVRAVLGEAIHYPADSAVAAELSKLVHLQKGTGDDA